MKEQVFSSYNDGVYYGTLTAPESVCEAEIKAEIKSNNTNPKKNYHISRVNFKDV